MSGILEKICADKRAEVEEARQTRPYAALEKDLQVFNSPVRSFRDALEQPGTSIIAEIKRKSPSAGLIREDFDLEQIARTYEANGARAVSVLTDGKYFGGEIGFVPRVKAATGLPVLRKGFIIDEYQILEARLAGADAILLIARILDDETLIRFLGLAGSLGMDCLLEVHDQAELERALKIGADIIGINNRNLDTLAIDLATAVELKKMVPEGKTVVSESGIKIRADIERLQAAGISAFLIGETLMKADDMGKALRMLIGTTNGVRPEAQHRDER